MKVSVPEFETSRLYLRPISLDMVDGYKKYFIDYEVIRHLSAVVPWPYPENGVSEFLQNVILPPQGIDRWTWGIFLKSNNTELIGCVDLWRKGTPENRGFWLGKPFWGKGYMTEAVEPVMNYAFNSLGFDKLLFSNALGNTRSRRIKEKTGARLIGTRDVKFVDPTLTSAETWELTKENWKLFKNEITNHELQDNTAFDYISEAASIIYSDFGTEFTKCLHLGKFFAIAPANVEHERLLKFEQDGLTEPGQTVIKGDFRLTQVIRLDEDFAQKMSLAIQRWPGSLAVGFDSLSGVEINTFNLSQPPFGILVNKHPTTNELVDFVNSFSTAWRTVAMVVDHPTNVRSPIQLTECMRLFAVSAYDGESFIYWIRS
jgi:ribosomal-protein-alanine N-acetyltransferase